MFRVLGYITLSLPWKLDNSYCHYCGHSYLTYLMEVCFQAKHHPTFFYTFPPHFLRNLSRFWASVPLRHKLLLGLVSGVWLWCLNQESKDPNWVYGVGLSLSLLDLIHYNIYWKDIVFFLIKSQNKFMFEKIFPNSEVSNKRASANKREVGTFFTFIYVKNRGVGTFFIHVLWSS